MLRIYFNEFYDGRPYLDEAGFEGCFGVEYCGEARLLQLLTLHGGIIPPVAKEAQRQVAYYTNMLTKVREGMFLESFTLDPLSVSNTVLGWRDALVSAGWDFNSGESEKLKFIREMEPTSFPKGTADCWHEVLLRSMDSPLLPDGSEITVTQREETLSLKMKVLLSNLRKQGIDIKFVKNEPFAEGDLGMVQRWVSGSMDSSEPEERLELKNDGSFRIIRFDTDEEAMKFVATCPTEKWDVYLCQQAKQFDNILRYLGQPVCGSDFGNCRPQVVQLFAIGNGTFEKPLNLHRILAWLDSPITPVGRRVSHALAKALSASGGIGNEEWERTVSEYIATFEDEKQKKVEERRLKTYLPFLETQGISEGMVSKSDVTAFNKALHHWATGLLSMEKFPYDKMVRDQLGKLAQQCECLLGILKSYESDEFSFTDLQNWCQSIVSDATYRQYDAEVGCRTLISREGNLHSSATSLVWFCICDDETPAFPFDFLTEGEIRQLQEGGVLIDDRNYYARRRNNAMLRTLMKTQKITIIESAKVAGQPVKRHPLMIQLQALVKNIADVRIDSQETAEDAWTEVEVVDNRSDSLFAEVEDGIVVPRRTGKESYTSLEMIIQHPFDYVCKYLASLTDTSRPSLSDVDRTMGNVAHKIIEKVFGEDVAGFEAKGSEYETIFNEAVDAVGLMLRQPEYTVELKELHSSMVGVLSHLKKFVEANGLRVEGCEVELEAHELEEGCELSSRADMLLSAPDCKVVLDFKWTGNRKKYADLVASGTALQLSVYKWLAQKQYRCKVKAAYVLLPSMTVISADPFESADPVALGPETFGRSTIEEAFNGYAFRLMQLKAGRIERAEGLTLEESEYGAAQTSGGMFPLKTGRQGGIRDSYEYFKELR